MWCACRLRSKPSACARASPRGSSALGLTGLALDRRALALPLRRRAGLRGAGASRRPAATRRRRCRARSNASSTGRSRGAARATRFVSSPSTRADAFQLVLVYDHYVASGDSIARLLTGIACALHAAPTRARRCRWSATRPSYRSLFSAPSAVGGARHRSACRAWSRDARRAYRPRYDRIEDGHNAYTYLRLGPHQHDARCSRTAKAWGVTLNELLMACLMLALSPLAARRRGEPRRNELAVASILNMRQDFGPDARDALSPFLAAFRVSHTVPEGIGLRQLALEVHMQTRAHQARPPVPAEPAGARRVGAVVAAGSRRSQRHGVCTRSTLRCGPASPRST